MIFISKSNVLTVGIDNKAESLRELPIRVVEMRFGIEAVSSLKTEKFDSVISKWDLADMKNGGFLKSLRTAKPNIPAIAIIETGNNSAEIAARSLGVSAVLTEDTSGEHFCETVCQILGLMNRTSIKAIYAVENR